MSKYRTAPAQSSKLPGGITAFEDLLAESIQLLK